LIEITYDGSHVLIMCVSVFGGILWTVMEKESYWVHHQCSKNQTGVSGMK